MASEYYSALVNLSSAHSHYADGVIFLLAFSEAVPVVGTFVPGLTLVVAISALATNAGANPWLLLAAATLGAIAGDGMSFGLGQLFSSEILNSRPLDKYPHFIAQSEKFIAAMAPLAFFSRGLRPSSAPLSRWWRAFYKCLRDCFMRQICKYLVGNCMGASSRIPRWWCWQWHLDYPPHLRGNV
jgi:membrane protein YqaA with SNARE-associated domain